MRLPAFVAVLAGLLSLGTANAAPSAIPYVGYLTFADSGAPFDGVIDSVEAVLWDSASPQVGDTPVWSGSYTSVPVSGGILSLVLSEAAGDPLDGALIGAHLDGLWLALTIDGIPLLPLQAIYSVPYALQAQNAAQLGGIDAGLYVLQSETGDAAFGGIVSAGTALVSPTLQNAEASSPNITMSPDGNNLGLGLFPVFASAAARDAALGANPPEGQGAIVLSGTDWQLTALTLYLDGAWRDFRPFDSSESIQATGGTVSTFVDGDTTWRIHTFTNVGTENFVVTSGSGSATVEYLVVGGGGGGGHPYGGGGGAGGVLSGTTNLISGAYPITVGTGGAGRSQAPNAQLGGDGQPSSLGSIVVAAGGGGGGCWNMNSPLAGVSGASGGGGGSKNNDDIGASGGAGTVGQGSAGGDGRRYLNGGGGGGGGAGGPGITSFVSNVSGAGGPGITSSISGVSVEYGGGGAGGIGNSAGTYSSGATFAGAGSGGFSNETILATNGQDAAATTGSGGGGGGGIGQGFSGTGNSGAGGSGIVIIRYEIPSP